MKASVIVLNWDGIEYLGPCLDAVLAQDCDDFEVIVVDNGSTDGSADFVSESYRQVRLIRNERNLGFAGGNNCGLKAATGDLLVLLNNDTEVRPGWLRALARTAADPGVGIVGAKALYPDGKIQHAGGYVGKRGAGSHYGHGERDTGQFDQVREVDYVTGASLAITREVLEAIGELDEGFSPIYYEDVDWCYRARRANYGVVYAPDAVLIHKEASVTADVSHEGMFLQQRHRLRFVLKHWSAEQIVHEFLPAERAWLEGLDEGGERLIAATHHAYLHHLLNLHQLMSWRQILLGSLSDEAEILADVLLRLRTTVPLRPTRIPRESRGTSHETGVEQMRHRATVKEVPFNSKTPILGPLIARFRHLWNLISTQWYVRPLIQQQNEYNLLILARLQHLEQIQRRLAEVLATYIGEDGREIAELAQEVRRLNSLLADLPADDKP
jgi:GT2 family glycosyltransferase